MLTINAHIVVAAMVLHALHYISSIYLKKKLMLFFHICVYVELLYLCSCLAAQNHLHFK